MFKILTQEEFTTLASSAQRVTVYKEILGDQMTPVQVYLALHEYMKGATLLESSPKEKNAGRCSFLGFTPIAELKIKRNSFKGDVLNAIREFYQSQKAVNSHELTGFAGGVVGFFSYEAAQLFEEVLHNDQKKSDFPDVLFKSYRDHVLFDLQTGQVVLATVVDITEEDLGMQYKNAISRLNDFYKIITDTPSLPALASSLFAARGNPGLKAKWCTEPGLPRAANNDADEAVDDVAYIAAGKIAKQHILAGDAFQIVLARTFSKNFTAKPFDIYRILRYRNPSPYMFYIDNEDYIICGASPEKMISVKDNIVQSCPLAGTRPRGEGYDDAIQAADLLADTKEVAEHMMLVDLARNDIGAVAKPGTVRVTKLKQIQHFSHVMHISSTVEAPLREDKDALDTLRASFPAGTLSGAPKIRAMQIIDELEQKPRMLYGGVIGFLDAKGDFDSCIAIRMAILKENKAYVTAGAGIVYDSDLQKEADETRHKARAVLEAIDYAQAGLE